MSVRGSKNKRVEEIEKLYERCHLNEESLSAQLQVNLEYKVRLEKSLQQEKSEHVQIKDDMQNKLEEERQARERENLESINKFTALQQKYKFLESQHEDVNLECSKLRQLQLSELEEKSRLETQLQSLKDELKLFKENKENDIRLLKEKNSALENENSLLKMDKAKLINELHKLEKQKSVGNEMVLPQKSFFNATYQKIISDSISLQKPEVENKSNVTSTKSSTSGSKAEQEFFPSGHIAYMNTSTPMINPDAVMSQDKSLSALPVPQPRQESFQNIPLYQSKENVGAKPEELFQQRANVQEDVLVQGVLRAPDIMNDFAHIPEIQQYKEKLRRGGERNNNGGEVGDEGEPVVKNSENNDKQRWKDVEVEGLPFVRHPVVNDRPKKELYNYQGDYDVKKEEGEDDDDIDPLEYQHVNEKNHQLKKTNIADYDKIPLEDKRESVMIQPK